MKLLLILTCSLLFSATSEFNVKGMMCGKSCVKMIENNVGALEGVKKCEVNFNKGVMTVDYDETKTNPDVISKSLNEKGTAYSCSIKKDEEKPKGFFKRIFSWF